MTEDYEGLLRTSKELKEMVEEERRKRLADLDELEKAHVSDCYWCIDDNGTTITDPDNGCATIEWIAQKRKEIEKT